MYRINDHILEKKGAKIEFHEKWFSILKSAASNKSTTILVRIIEHIIFFFENYWALITRTGPWILDPQKKRYAQYFAQKSI